MTHSTQSDFHNAPHEIEYVDGAGEKTVYRLKPELSRGQEILFSRWLEKRARADAFRAAEEMPSDAADRYMERCQRQIAAGVYEWGSLASVEASRTPAGQKYIIYLMLLDEHPDMTEELAERIYLEGQKQLVAILTKQVEDADPKTIALLRKLLNIGGEAQSPSATHRTTGSPGKSKKQRRHR